MVIYLVEHYSGLYPLLTLRVMRHGNEKAILIGRDLDTKEPFVSNLRTSGLFEYVINYKRVKGLPLEETEDQITEALCRAYDPLINDNKINMKEASNIYVGGYDKYTSEHFSLYLEVLKLEYVIVEIAPNVMHRSAKNGNRLRYNKYTPKSLAYFNMIKHTRPFNNDGDCIKKLIIWSETKWRDSSGKRDLLEVYDFSGNPQMRSEDKQLILSCFGMDSDFLPTGKFSLLLPNGFSATRNLARHMKSVLCDVLYTNSKYAMIYAMQVDYFAKEGIPVLYNPHPNGLSGANTFDPLKLRGIRRMPEHMPIELLRWIPNVKIMQTFALKTSAVWKLADVIEKDMSLGMEFLKVFHCMDKLYVILKIIDRCNKNSNILYYGIPKKVMDTLESCSNDGEARTLTPLKFSTSGKYKKVWRKINKEGRTLIVNFTLSEYVSAENKDMMLEMLKNCHENSLVFFVNALYEYAFVSLENEDLLKYVVPIVIKRTSIDDGETLGDTGDTVLYAFCKNEEIRNQLKNINLTKALKYLNVLLEVSPISAERDDAEMRKCYEFAVSQAAYREVVKYEESIAVRNAMEMLRKANKTIKRLEQSTSWRITRPLRVIAQWLRQKNKNQGGTNQ
ncbi:MAG: hypothetical protein FWG65_02910 [Turicibacter sp.]|nr:hypothetical protein [Turicibacter sp.]